MKFDILSRRVAAAGAVSAMAAAGLVATAGVASAESVVSNTYSCTAAGQTFPMFLTTAAPGIGAYANFGLKAGTALPGGALTVTNTFTVPTAVHSLLVANHVRDITAPTYTGSFGGNPVGVDGVAITIAGMTDDGNGQTWSSDHADADQDGQPDEGNGVNAPFTAPAAGAQDVVSPAALDMVATLEDGTTTFPINCTVSGTPGSYETINVVKNASTTSAKSAKKHFAHGSVAKVKATVASAHMPTGKVLLKKGSKKLATATLNDLGKAVLKTSKLPVGKNSLTVVYKGDGYNTASKATKVIVTVVK